MVIITTENIFLSVKIVEIKPTPEKGDEINEKDLPPKLLRE
jgi:hypothetical protein